MNDWVWLFIWLAASAIAALAFGVGFQLGRQSPREPVQPDQPSGAFQAPVQPDRPLIWPPEATRRQQAAQRAAIHQQEKNP